MNSINFVTELSFTVDGSDYKYKSELQNPEGKKSVIGITFAW